MRTIPILVQVNEHVAKEVDPNEDKNPYTEVKVSSRWKQLKREIVFYV